MFPVRSFPRSFARAGAVSQAAFHEVSAFHTTSPAALVRAGDRIPDLDVLVENSPGNKVNLSKELGAKGKALIIGVPAAFSR